VKKNLFFLCFVLFCFVFCEEEECVVSNLQGQLSLYPRKIPDSLWGDFSSEFLGGQSGEISKHETRVQSVGVQRCQPLEISNVLATLYPPLHGIQKESGLVRFCQPPCI